ncbi:hypothetical protein [Polyangium jinanense]|uniref:Uncharacterized protein n=1 Tax=Polyangium jinanense TaxID=2829994 RepID=A0A9X3X8R2_9BACT|nr:hypothetical protein [Polyangium jinanense]MDC3957893.1 hypothetical protein [Polyangium jinanense]MDC3983446.1 hypothetical protein [Polyangium jinanense]
MANMPPPGGGYPPGGPPGYPPQGYPQQGGAYGPPQHGNDPQAGMGQPSPYGNAPHAGMGPPPYPGYGPQAGMGQPSPYGDAPQAGVGQPPPYGNAPHAGMGYGPQPGAPMGAPPMGAPMGAPPMGAPMGAPPMGVPMGAPMPQQAQGGGFNMLKVVGIGVAVVLGATGIGAFVWYGYTHPSVRIVNVTGKDGVSVTLDGQELAKDLKNAATENAAVVVTKNVASGAHKLEAKDASGKVLESFTFEFKSGTNGYVYAPGRAADSKTCFIVQTDEYKTISVGLGNQDRFKTLDPTKNIWELPTTIEFWFQDTPESVEIKTKKGDSSNKTVTKRALRQAPCDDPDFMD